jgi:hypothetical protein
MQISVNDKSEPVGKMNLSFAIGEDLTWLSDRE